MDSVISDRSAGLGMSRRTAARVSLLLVGIPQLAIGAWALLSPRGWYDDFPGGGREWLPPYGPFNEHFAVDIGSTFLALGVLLVLAAVWLERRVVIAAVVAYLVYQVPHYGYHVGADDRLSSGDQVLNAVGIGLAVLASAGVLVLARRDRGAPKDLPPVRSSPNGSPAGRLGPPPRGLVGRVTGWYVRRRYGRSLAPVDAYLHHRRLMFGYSGFETAVERSHRVPERLKALGEMKAAALAGCEWCLDFGSWLSLGHGVTEPQLRELRDYRDSDAFDDVEKLVIEYAEAMTRTPAQVDDELFARLREHFDDAQMVELTNAIAIENLRARFNHALGLDVQGFSEGAFCAVPERAALA